MAAFDMKKTEPDPVIALHRGDRVYVCTGPGEPDPSRLRAALAERSRANAAAKGERPQTAVARDVFLISEGAAAAAQGCGPFPEADRAQAKRLVEFGSMAKGIAAKALPGVEAVAEPCGLLHALDSGAGYVISYSDDSASCTGAVMSSVTLD